MSTWPIQRHDDPEMRDAIVTGIAQYILRGWAHTRRPGYTDAQVLARARRDLAEAKTDGYTFPDGEDDRIAADAAKTADWQRDHNVNWDQWAFGH